MVLSFLSLNGTREKIWSSHIRTTQWSIFRNHFIDLYFWMFTMQWLLVRITDGKTWLLLSMWLLWEQQRMSPLLKMSFKKFLQPLKTFLLFKMQHLQQLQIGQWMDLIQQQFPQQSSIWILQREAQLLFLRLSSSVMCSKVQKQSFLKECSAFSNFLAQALLVKSFSKTQTTLTFNNQEDSQSEVTALSTALTLTLEIQEYISFTLRRSMPLFLLSNHSFKTLLLIGSKLMQSLLEDLKISMLEAHQHLRFKTSMF